jgi:hypothetical protein
VRNQEASALEPESRPCLLEPDRDIPLPAILAERHELIATVLDRARTQSAAILTGSTGSGKTILARLTARKSDQWDLVDFRNVPTDETIERLELALGELGQSSRGGVILDDLNEIEDPKVLRALSRFLAALRRRDALCLITCYREPSARAISELGIDRAGHIAVPDLTVEEVGALVTAAGGDRATWANVVHMAGAFGHPQLIQAIISGLKARSWPEDELGRLKAFERSSDVEAERLATRQRLVAAVPSEARTLLYRISLLLDRFDRPLVLALGALNPEVGQPGEQLDTLIGPWIEQVGQGRLRVSPLLQSAGQEILAADEQQLVHRTVAERIVAGRLIDVDKANSAYLHGLLGKSEPSLMKLAYAVIGADAATRKVLSEWMLGIRLHRMDRPIYPGNPTLSFTLRFAQFLLVAERDNVEAIRKCWQVLRSELNEERDTKFRDHFEYMILAKVLIDRAAAGLLPNWIDLILRFDELSNADAKRKKLVKKMEQPRNGHPALTLLGMFFILQALGVRSVTDLKAAFDRLDRATPEQRKKLFADAVRMPRDFALIVNSAWLAEHQRGNIDAHKCAEAYGQMAIQASSWGYRELALRCHVARSIMFDEYAEDPVAAQQALDDATRILGADPALARARAKILYRRKDHQGALRLLRETRDKIALGDPVERAHTFREAAICAAEIDEWAEARDWFAAARDAARNAPIPSMQVMTMGLRADEALAAFKAGDTDAALVGFDQTLDELVSLDVTSSIAAGYCHRVVRHGVLWLFQGGTQQQMNVDGQPAHMVPGMCSNPEPSDLKDMPLGSLDCARYLLAQIEIAMGVDAGIERGLRARLNDRSIPAMEIMLRNERLGRDIRRLDVAGFIQNLPAWVDAQVYLEAHGTEIRNQGLENPAYGEIDQITPNELQKPIVKLTVEDALLSFGIVAALKQEPVALTSLYSRVSESQTSQAGKEIAKIMATGDAANQRFEDLTAAEVHKIANRGDLTPDELFIASLRFVQAAKRSNFKKLLSSALAAWARECWAFAIAEQRFYLRNPSVTVPAIEDALAASDGDLAFVGKLLVAIQPAVNPRIDNEFREFLLSL